MLIYAFDVPRSVIELLKKLKGMFNDDEVAREVLFDEVLLFSCLYSLRNINWLSIYVFMD